MNKFCRDRMGPDLLLLRFIASVTLFAVVLLLSSCGGFEWKTLDSASTDNTRVSVRSMINGAWNPPILEILQHNDPDDSETADRLVRLVGRHHNARIEYLWDDLIVASTFGRLDTWRKEYFIFSGTFPPGNRLEIDYRDEPVDMHSVASDSADSVGIEVYESDDWKRVRLLQINWTGLLERSQQVPVQRIVRTSCFLYFLNLGESHFSLTKDRRVRCELKWHGSNSVDTLLITPPETVSGFILIQTPRESKNIDY